MGHLLGPDPSHPPSHTQSPDLCSPGGSLWLENVLVSREFQRLFPARPLMRLPGQLDRACAGGKEADEFLLAFLGDFRSGCP